MQVPYIPTSLPLANQVPALLDANGVPFAPIAHANWQHQYPYVPRAEFRIAQCAEGLLLHYRVWEQTVRAHYAQDNGDVWTDSCVEFFCIPDAADGIYYNLECNCVGTLLLGSGQQKAGRVRAPQQILDTIGRWSSLGRTGFEERPATEPWEVALVVPLQAFFQHRLTTLRGAHVRANFYKCGDALSQPHFLSWAPISLPKPNFHCPEFFGELEF